MKSTPSQRLYSLAVGQQGKFGKKDAADLKRYEDELTAALRVHVPGLVSSDNGLVTSAALAVDTTQMLETGGSTADLARAGHRTLVKPDAFNLAKIFAPTLTFIAKVKDVMPSDIEGTSDFDGFLEEFIRDTFLPQLEERAHALFAQATAGLEISQEDQASKQLEGDKPVTRSVRNVLTLLDGIYIILAATPFHRVSISRLIIQLLVQYYQRCSDRFSLLVALQTEGEAAGMTVRTCASWAQRPELLEHLSIAADKSQPEAKRAQALGQENKILLQLARQGTGTTFSDLTTSRKKLLALGLLGHSLSSFVERAARLEGVSAFPESAPTTTLLDEGDSGRMPLPLNDEMLPRFQALPHTFRSLSNIVLFTLRCELRIRAAYHLTLAVTDGNYILEEATLEPDPHVVDLNTELVSCDDIFAETLPESERK